MTAPLFPGQSHDHTHCIEQALEQAEHLCQVRKVRLTGQRRQVLALIWQSHKPLGAYEILAQLSQGRDPVAPPTVYRALDFLIEQGLVHRLASCNSYMGCPAPEAQHPGQLLICRHCGRATELLDSRIEHCLQQAATEAGFKIEQQTLELLGLCQDCQEPS